MSTSGIRLETLSGKTTIQIFECIEDMLEEADIQPSQFQDRLIFLSIYNDVIWWIPKNSVCFDNAKRVTRVDESFRQGEWPFLGLGTEENSI